MSTRIARFPIAGLFLLALGVFTAGSCRGLVNASPGLRWWLFENYGASQLCPEMLKRGQGLRLQDRGPVVGRFFPTGCKIDIDSANHLVTVNFDGWGYAYMSLARRVTFSTQAAIQFKPDFYLGEEDIYVWGTTNRLVSGPNFKIRTIENPVASLPAQLTPLGNVANMFGNQIAAGELTRGFTVVQNWDTEAKTFALGIIKPPYKPHTPYQVADDNKYVFLNETIEVQYNQRDYLGPFEVVDSDQQIELRIFNRGAAAEALVIERGAGDVWRDQYIQGKLTPPPGPIIGGTVLGANRETRARFRLAPGRQYYVVIDHTNVAGTVAPQGNLLTGGPAAVLSAVIQLGDSS